MQMAPRSSRQETGSVSHQTACVYTGGEGTPPGRFWLRRLPPAKGGSQGKVSCVHPAANTHGSWGMDVPGRFGELGERQQPPLQRLL